MQALERHIPTAKILLSGITPAQFAQNFVWKNQGSDVLCSFGVHSSLYTQARSWLDGDPNRRLIFIEDRPEALAQLLEESESILLLKDLRVKLYFLESPLQIEPLAKKIGWSAVFLKMELLNLRQSPHFESFYQVIQSTHLAANLLLSDAADWGCSAIRHAKKNLSRLFHFAADLSFPNIPALIVGAGPSLEKNRHLLEPLRDKALICAGGHALDRLRFPPHFAAAIDKEEPLQRISFPKVPFCFQARTHAKNFSLIQGESFLVPEGHFSFLNWLTGQEGLFDGGWTVGNFLTALAVQWGCNPIVFVGMDYCYSGKKKYAQGSSVAIDGLVETKNRFGETVWTQRDWLMAVEWTEKFAEKHPDRQFLNATEGGLEFLTEARLQDLDWKGISVQEKVEEAMRRAPAQKAPSRWAEWEQSLKRCALLCEANVHNLTLDGFEEEVVFNLLLSPLWQIWKPVFERQLELDLQKMDLAEKVRLNELLFYQQVVQEHLNALR